MKNLLIVSRVDLALAFEAWEKGWRIKPDEYRSPSECACMSVSDVSAERAEYFYHLLVAQGVVET